MVYILPKLLCRVMHVHSVYVLEKLNLVKIFENVLTIKTQLFIVKYFPCTSSALWAFNYCPKYSGYMYGISSCIFEKKNSGKIFLKVQLFMVFPLHIFAV